MSRQKVEDAMLCFLPQMTLDIALEKWEGEWERDWSWEEIFPRARLTLTVVDQASGASEPQVRRSIRTFQAQVDVDDGVGKEEDANTKHDLNVVDDADVHFLPFVDANVYVDEE